MSRRRQPPSAALPVIGSGCFLLSDKVANRAPSVRLANTIPFFFSSSRLISRSDFYQMMSLSLGASAKNKSARRRRRTSATKVFSTFKCGGSILLILGYSFPREPASHGAGKRGFPEPQRTSGSSRYNSGTNCVGQQLQLLSNLIASANHITQKKPGAKVLRCYLFIRSFVCHYWRESAEARRSVESGEHGCKSVACR